MSTNQGRLRAAIQRIARTDPDIRDAIAATRNRGEQAAEGARAESQGEQQRICCDGSTSDNANPGTTERDPSTGGQDASSGLDPNDPANLSMGEGSLTGLTDCATGEPVCFDGAGFIPPDGWDDPQEPPIDPYYTEGSYWTIDAQSFGLYKRVSLQNAGADLLTDYRAAFPERTVEIEYYGDPVTSGAIVDADAGGSLLSLNIGQSTCGGGYDCTGDSPYLEGGWPSDSCVNLAIKNGTIVGSKYDPENDGTYSKPMSEIQLCDGAGESLYLAPSADGGWKTVDSTNTNGYLYDAQGKQIAHIDGAEYSDPNV